MYLCPSQNREEIKALLSAEGEAMECVLRRGLEVKEHLDHFVHLRGLIELGNDCEKNCFYCGLRSGNDKVAGSLPVPIGICCG